ncbi:acyl--CoA ligase [Microbacterium resistens]|uniref:class I adenylate-forming enzyme family protein n=1 Tax=Microbacterium resistens TaxID=156977 RepID=UPI001C594F28|nr:class I adenylate-forming enzyme family protein [Microbacterium resistens]MBW1638472.1 acyl--CoA ligase [Microbacterium resistens]
MSWPADDELVSDILRDTSRRFADEPALLHQSGWLTFADVDRLAAGLATEIRRLGATSGARVVIYLDNGVAARLADHAVLSSRFVRVALSSRLHPREAAAIALDAMAPVVICSPARTTDLTAALARVESSARVLVLDDDTATLGRLRDASDEVPDCRETRSDSSIMLMYSSGTTGQPKGVVVTDRTWTAQMRAAFSNLPEITHDDVVVLSAPMAHFGGSIALDCMMRGARTVIVEPFDPHRVLDAVETYGGTIVPLVPTLLSRLLDALPGRESAVATVRAVPYGGSPAAVDVLVRATGFFPEALTQFYGLAEALAPLAVLSPEDHRVAAAHLTSDRTGSSAWRSRLQSAGRWVPGVEHRNVGGELLIRSETVMPRYWNREDLTASVLQDGWFLTGDYGHTDEEGYLHLLGRRSDTIITGGFNVRPREVERVIEQIDGIQDVAVIGLPDDRWGEGVHAFVVLDESSAAFPVDDVARVVREACLERIASYKKPVGVHVLDRLPRNSFGKIDRTTLREHFLASTSTDPTTDHERS